MSNPTKTFVIIDGHAIIHRAYHALPPLTSKDGTIVNAVFGFSSMLLKIMADLKPDYLAVSFDVAGDTFRDEIYEDYKATREKSDDELYDQIPLVYDVVNAFNIPIYEKEGYEADDLIGTIAAEIREKHDDVKVIIVTGDKDILQLVETDRVQVNMMGRGMSDFTLYDEHKVDDKYGFGPHLIADFKGLMGDPSDNIPGVKGVGKKTATMLLTQVGDIETIYRELDEHEAAGTIKSSVAKKLREGKEDALMSKELATIVQNVKGTKFRLADAVTHEFDEDEVAELFSGFQFYSLIKRLPGKRSGKTVGTKKVTKKKAVNVTVVAPDDIASLVNELKERPTIACTALLAGGDVNHDPISGFLFLVEDKTWWVELKSLNQSQRNTLFSLFSQKQLTIIGHDLKTLSKVLLRYQVSISCRFFDVMIASYILNASTRAHDLRSIILRETGVDIGEKQQQSLFGDEPSIVAQRFRYVLEIYPILQEKLSAEKQDELFQNMEMGLLPVLARMELSGIKLDMDMMKQFSKEVHKEIDSLTKKVHKLAGREFNVSSSAQLRDILFDDLDLPTAGIKKGKTGYSTAASELEKLHGLHPIIECIERYREITKLQNTYIDVLPTLVDEQDRIHTSFNQTVAATGRLSSSDPNLQNIPIRTDYGKRIRDAFISEEGYELLAADYSQFELRIVASLAQDEKLIDIFQKGEDVHRATAAAIHGISLEEVTASQRRSAKEVNFGVLYGMGAFGLAQRTGLSQKEAKEFIDKYFDTFSGVATYLEAVKEKAAEDGYAETMFGRRRHIPELQSSNYQLRAAGERMAINMPVQGSQADIIKLAMIEIDHMLLQDGYYERDDVRFLLQVHDELVFEVKKSVKDSIVPAITALMEKAVSLAVPVVVEGHVGKRWGGLK